LVDGVEREREAFLRRFFPGEPYDPTRYDLILNLNFFDEAQAVEVIVAALEARKRVGRRSGVRAG